MKPMDSNHSDWLPTVPRRRTQPDHVVGPTVTVRLEGAYGFCRAVVRSHREEFPIASRLLPRQFRGPVAVIYAFARQAENLAREGQLTVEERLNEIAALEAKLDLVKAGARLNDPLFLALSDTLERHPLPIRAFYDLLQASRMDIQPARYATFRELMGYCRYSANPVGRLLLHLYRAATPRAIVHSDALSSAVRLLSIVCNLAEDYRQGQRIYLPQDDMARYGVTEDHFRQQCSDDAVQAVVALQLERIRRLLDVGAPLSATLRGRVMLDSRLAFAVTLRLWRVLCLRPGAFTRPRLGARDWAWIGLHALVPHRLRGAP
jgi:squalene synthase HpnC